MLTLLRGLWTLMAGERLRFALAAAFMVIAAALIYVPPLVAQAALDALAASTLEARSAEPSWASRWLIGLFGGDEALTGRLWLAGLLVVAFAAAAQLATYARGRLAAEATESVIARLRDRLYEHLHHVPLSYHDKAESGDLVQRCTSDVDTLRLFMSEQLMEIVRAMLLLVVPLPLMLAIDWRMTLLSCALLPFIVAFGAFYFSKVQASFLKKDEAEARMTASVQENLTGIRVVRAFARQGFERDKFDQRNTDHRQKDMRLFRLFAWFWSASDLMCFAQRGLVIIGGSWMLAQGHIAIGAFFFFLASVEQFLWPMRMMGRLLSELGKAIVSWGRLSEVLAAERETQPGPARAAPGSAHAGDSRAVLPLGCAVAFEHVSFGYDPAHPVLRDVSFELPPGQSLALLGPSGAGKTTIVSLLLRLYDPQAGRITIDGRDIREMDRRDVRRLTASVLQEPFLFSKTVAENIRLVRPGMPDSEIHEAAQIACVHESIERFEQGYSTLVGERGVTLSGGQRQRVAIARAIASSPPILVLDDSLSAVDTETEKQILAALRSRARRQTTLLIAHRLSTLMEADRVLVIENGAVTASGTHRELIARDGLYRRLWDLENTRSSEIHQGLAHPA